MQIDTDSLVGAYAVGLVSAKSNPLGSLATSLIVDELLTGAPSGTVLKQLAKMGKHVREGLTQKDDAE